MAWIVVFLTTVVLATAALATFTFPAIAPIVAADLGLPASLIGYLVAIAYFGAVASSIICGQLVRRWGACRTSQLSLVTSGLGCALTSIPEAVFISAGAFLIGLGHGMTNPPASHLLVRFVGDKNRNFIFSLKQTGLPIGGVLAGLISPVIAVNWGWQWAPIFVSVCSFAVAITLQFWRDDWDTDRDPQASLIERPFESLGLLWNNRLLRTISPTGFMFSVIQMCLLTFLVTYLVQEIGFTIIEAGFLFALTQLSGGLSRLVWGWCADRLKDGLMMIMILGILIAIVTMGVFVIQPSWPKFTIYIVMICYGSTAIGWNGVYLAAVSNISGSKSVGTATGAIMALSLCGVIVGPPIFSAFYSAIGSYGTTYGLLVVVALIGTASAYSTRQMMKSMPK